ncbi:MAG TPA: DNA primase [Gammaproteobacteria bacterium]|nr:DNA primase [Gammaproteobacteria bacterium]
MARIPQSFIDELMNRVDIVEVIDARVPLKKAGREYSACCPFHNEKTPSFYVSPAKQFYHCFGCGAHGTAVGFLMEYEHLSFPEAVEELAREAGLEVPREVTESRRQGPKVEPDLYDLLAKADRLYRGWLRTHPAAPRAVNYLKQRGLSGEIAAEFGLGFAPPGWDNLVEALGNDPQTRDRLVTAGMLIRKDDGHAYDRFRDRIMFPIRDRRGRTIAFGGRILPDAQETGDKAPAKYLNSPETPLFHKGRELYGLYEARQALRDIPRLLVVEGYMDVVSLAQFGVHYAVATLGTATTAEHLHRLFRVAPEVVFCFDGDRAGREAAVRAMENALPVMREGRQIRFMFLPEGEDPDTRIRAIGREAFEAEIGDSLTFSEFFFQHLTEAADTGTIDGRAQLVERARPLLSRMAPGVFRHLLLQQLARLARLEVAELERLLATGEKQPPSGQAGRGGRLRGQAQTPLSPVRVALMRLLHSPKLAAAAGDPSRFAGLDVPGLDLLREVIEILQENPHLNTSALLERWRDHPHVRHLEKLALWEPAVDDEAGLKAEFLGALARLDQKRLQQRYEWLLARSEQGSLSAGEKQELKDLFATLNRDKRLNSGEISE